MNTTEFIRLSDRVFEYLEYINYPEYVMDFEHSDVARAIHGTISSFYVRSIKSPRLIALTIFGLTYENQVSKLGKNLTVN